MQYYIVYKIMALNNKKFQFQSVIKVSSQEAAKIALSNGLKMMDKCYNRVTLGGGGNADNAHQKR